MRLPRSVVKLFLFGTELAAVQSGIETVLGQQRGTRALFHHVALIHNKDHIGMVNSGKPVSNDEYFVTVAIMCGCGTEGF